MTIQEVRTQVKFEALNKIRKIYNKYNIENGIGLNSLPWSDSWAEQRDDKVKQIIQELELKLKNLRQS